MIKSLTRKALHRVGYDIHKKRNLHELKSIPQATSSGFIIEFIGPSGIGKTTFFERIKNEYRKDWLFKDDIAHVCEVHDAFKLLGKHEEQATSQIMKLAYHSLYEDNLSLPMRDGIYQFLTKEMKTDIFYRKSALGKGLLSEGGVMMNFCNELVLARDGASAEILLAMNDFFKNRYIVNFRASDNYILENLKKRKDDIPGAGNDWIGSLGVQKSLDMIKSYNTSNTRLVKLATSLGARVLEIDAEIDFKENKALFKGFVESIVNRNFERKEIVSKRSSLEQLEV